MSYVGEYNTEDIEDLEAENEGLRAEKELWLAEKAARRRSASGPTMADVGEATWQYRINEAGSAAEVEAVMAERGAVLASMARPAVDVDTEARLYNDQILALDIDDPRASEKAAELHRAFQTRIGEFQ